MHSLAQMEAYVTRQIKKLIELKRYWKKPHLIARYFNSLRQFRAMGGIVSHYCPIVTEFKDNAGVAGGQYFHQDLLVAHFVANKKPRRHIDVGSRIDGFVAHIASFRSIDVLDIRDLPDTGHENIRFCVPTSCKKCKSRSLIQFHASMRSSILGLGVMVTMSIPMAIV